MPFNMFLCTRSKMGVDAYLHITFNTATKNIQDVVHFLQTFQIPEKFSAYKHLEGSNIWELYLESAQVNEQQTIYINDILTNYPEDIDEEKQIFHKEFREFLEFLVEHEGVVFFSYHISY